MIKIENVETSGWEAAIRGMRNPMNSWDKSDTVLPVLTGMGTILGEADLELMNRLAFAGSADAKYRRMIVVTLDITAPLYWWAEFDTYKVGTVRNSCSKMHKLLAKPFEMSDFSFDKLPGYRNEVTQFRPPVEEGEEIWAPARGHIGYAVSNCGRIRRLRFLSGSLHQDGYIFVTVDGKQIPLHRLIAETFIPNPQKLPEVNHKDGNKQNNFVENLEWVTRRENQAHAVAKGLQPKSVKTYKGKFTAEERQAIKEQHDSGVSKRELSRRYGVSHTCICDIINDRYKYADKVNLFEEVARPLVDMLNELRDSWLSCTDEAERKTIWYSIIQLLPESYNQRSTVMLNYEVLANIYFNRKNHKLDEWRAFCEWVKTLPYSELITLECKGAE